MSVTIRETIHHGDYYNRQHSTADTVGEAFALALRNSPYNAHVGPDNEWRGKCLESLRDRLHGDLGWANYEIVSHTGLPVNPRPEWSPT